MATIPIPVLVFIWVRPFFPLHYFLCSSLCQDQVLLIWQLVLTIHIHWGQMCCALTEDCHEGKAGEKRRTLPVTTRPQLIPISLSGAHLFPRRQPMECHVGKVAITIAPGLHSRVMERRHIKGIRDSLMCGISDPTPGRPSTARWTAVDAAAAYGTGPLWAVAEQADMFKAMASGEQMSHSASLAARYRAVTRSPPCSPPCSPPVTAQRLFWNVRSAQTRSRPTRGESLFPLFLLRVYRRRQDISVSSWDGERHQFMRLHCYSISRFRFLH